MANAAAAGNAAMTGGYRPSLDGVRAVAVLAVIAYHLGLPVSGGFLGVDIFFVLSGYLITDLLLSEYATTGGVRLARFWSRRARRLLPALLIVVSTCAVVVSRIEPLVGLGPRRGDMLATLGYYANWHFIATDQSYFAAFTGASPLRHMWSLAIEEQFYVVWPLLLLGLLRVTGQRMWICFAAVSATAVASAFALSTEYDATNASRAYMGTDGRAHELLVGVALAFVVRWRLASRVRPGSRVVAAVALVLAIVTAAAIAVMTDASPMYYRGGSLGFCLVVALCLLAIEIDPACEVARLLSRPQLVMIGRISYGLYLWHWPLLLWLRASEGGWQRKTLYIALTFTMAALSYVLVEAPVRRGALPWLRTSTRRAAICVPLALAMVAGCAVAATAVDGDVAAQMADHGGTICAQQGPGWCQRVARPPGGELIAVVGDSTARALDAGMLAEAKPRRFGYAQGGRAGCSIVPVAVHPSVPARARSCAASALPFLTAIRDHLHPDLWVLSDRHIRTPLYVAGKSYPIGSPQHDQAVVRQLRVTLEDLTATGARVALLETLPDGQPIDCALPRKRGSCRERRTSLADKDTERVNALMRESAAPFAGRVAFISYNDLVCTGAGGQCVPVLKGAVTRYDGVHYTKRFSRYLVPLLVDRLAAAGLLLPHAVVRTTSVTP